MKKKLLAILLTVCMVLSMAPTALAADSVFTDVKAEDWFAEEVEYVYDNGLMNGVGDNAFDPNGTVTRAMVWTTLARLDGVNTTGSDPWWLAGQQWAMENEISDGTMATENITREQLVTMIWRYAKYIDMDVSEGEDTNILSYTDALDVNEWAISAMQWACAVGIINGIDGALQPQGDASRAMLAAILYRFVEEVMPEEEEPKPSTPVVPSYPSYPVIPPHSHTYGAWTPNGDGTHTRYYNCGHTGSQTADCSYTYTFVDGEEVHTKTCSVCGYTGTEEHEYVNYKCVCGKDLTKWNGTIPAEMPDTLVVDLATKTITVNDAAAFAYLHTLDDVWASKYSASGNGTNWTDYDNGEGGDYYYHWQFDVLLNCDIDLGDIDWTPLNLEFYGNFNGQGHTIKNVKVTGSANNAGLFSTTKEGISNLTVDEVDVTGGEQVGAVVGYLTGGGVNNVTVKNATVTGTKYVGGITGYAYASITNSSVSGSTITIPANGAKEAGGLAGYLCTSNKTDADVTGNTVKDTVISAPTVASGLVAQTNGDNGAITVSGNTVDNVTVTTTDSTAKPFVSNNVKNTTIVNNTVNGCPAWNGDIPSKMPDTLVVDLDTKTITVNDAAAFAYLHTLDDVWASKYSASGNGTNWTDYDNGKGGDYYYHWRFEVLLNCDIDLGDIDWTPLNLEFYGNFNGQGHTIKNVKVTGSANNAGLFSTTKEGISNLTVDEVDVTGGEQVGAVVGYLTGGGVNNVTVKNATVTGTKYVGGITGYAYASITNSSVSDSEITIPDSGKKEAGGLAGYLCTSNGNDNVVTGNTVKDTTISAPTVASGLVAQPHVNNGAITISGNTVKNVTVTTADSTANAFVSNNVNGTTTVESNNEENCTINKN